MLAAALVEGELKPSARTISDSLQGAWYLEEARGSRNNDEFLGDMSIERRPPCSSE